MLLTSAILVLVTLQRAGELVLSWHNTARLLRKGAYEVCPGHYPLIVTLHATWLGGLWLLAWGRPVNFSLLAAFVLLQGLRIWVLATLGPRWTTRIIVVPGERLVADGPYRFVRHPNYWIVAGEVVCLPLAFGLAEYAAGFGVVNVFLLWLRIRQENAALGLGRRRI